ncbi:DNA repair protein RecN (Recombination protein N) [Fibrobacter sp. UWH9]|uniref:DNA repair protein RecN n=1 Tax=unclassified Fibrobacter TaxID=2634177 RepID=UPI000920A44E|nr:MULTISPECIES: DNA repair protein RecN [unclassified Fibrobacter]MDO4946810.1 DNA repair protein RecN [Fibrobacter sp.]OWV06680.1 DNA repair protein RecN [Fibrobacter sp. UWH3]SHH39695.1 DNA repair protein RecN (Recombination protein N) [Fibrobacter sp. UWH9]SHL23163.1 DNA repair protein RecN (Recombination protein N) [Fibrobacter sp. UWH5]
MLKQLSINGFTLISEAEVPFRQGFTAITGETGAGKSVLLKSLRVVCGDKAQGSFVRTGADKAVVEATFDISGEDDVRNVLKELELDDGNDELIIRREVLENGKGRARVNGSVVNLSDLQKLGEELIQMHGQSEQLLLRDTRTHAKMLDDYAGNGNLLTEYAGHWSAWNGIKSKIVETEEKAKNLAAQKDFLKFQFEELSKANLKEGEEEALEEKVNSASKVEAERRYLDEVQGILGGENGLLDQVQLLQAKMRTLAAKVPDYDEDLNALVEVADPFESICKDLMRLSPSAAVSAADIDRANARIAQIQKLKRKYRTDVAGLMELTEQRRTELDSLENLDADLEELERQANKEQAELNRIAGLLTEARKNAAERYDSAVSEILHSLGMPKAEFKTSIEEQALTPNGADRIEFLLAPNPGEGFKSLQKAVSGGELSRMLLAIKSVMAELDRVPLLIFDEVDSGISGEVGNSIGDALRKLGKHHQILTITHLHQVASRAENQLAVSKKEIDGRTFTSVVELDRDGRIAEISRMLGGDSDTVREHAKQLLDENL